MAARNSRTTHPASDNALNTAIDSLEAAKAICTAVAAAHDADALSADEIWYAMHAVRQLIEQAGERIPRPKLPEVARHG